MRTPAETAAAVAGETAADRGLAVLISQYLARIPAIKVSRAAISPVELFARKSFLR